MGGTREGAGLRIGQAVSGGPSLYSGCLAVPCGSKELSVTRMSMMTWLVRPYWSAALVLLLLCGGW